MGPVNARFLQDLRMNNSEGIREQKPGRFLTTRSPVGQHVKVFKQVRAPLSHVKERAYPKQVAQEGNVERYGELKIQKDETIFAAYDKVEMSKVVFVVAKRRKMQYGQKFKTFWNQWVR